MKTTRTSLLDKLDRVTDRAATFAITRGLPIRVSNKSTLIGNTLVEKNTNGLYNIISADKVIIYKDILLFDIAVIIAQRHNSGESALVRKILALEERFSKYHTDMLHYLNCLKGAQTRHDLERMTILEDKFQVAEISAKKVRDSIAVFKRIK